MQVGSFYAISGKHLNHGNPRSLISTNDKMPWKKKSQFLWLKFFTVARLVKYVHHLCRIFAFFVKFGKIFLQTSSPDHLQNFGHLFTTTSRFYISYMDDGYAYGSIDGCAHTKIRTGAARAHKHELRSIEAVFFERSPIGSEKESLYVGIDL